MINIICDDCWSEIIEYIDPITLHTLSKASPTIDMMIFMNTKIRYVFGYQQMLPISHRDKVAYKVGPSDMAIKANGYIYIVSKRAIINCTMGVRQNFKHIIVENYCFRTHGYFDDLHAKKIRYYRYGTFYVRVDGKIIVATWLDMTKYSRYHRIDHNHCIEVTSTHDICNKYFIDFSSNRLVHGSKKSLNVVPFERLFQ